LRLVVRSASQRTACNARAFGSGNERGLYLLTNTRALLQRLELGVHVRPEGQARERVRELYVATRNQARALSAVLELEGLG
jgi:hypothetical protein